MHTNNIPKDALNLTQDNHVYFNNPHKELLRELQIEYEACNSTFERYQKRVEKALNKGQGATIPPAKYLISNITSTFAGAIEEFINPKHKAPGWNVGAKRGVRKTIKRLKLSPEELAYITLKTLLDEFYKQEDGFIYLTSLIRRISENCVQNYEFQQLKLKAPKELKRLFPFKENNISKIELERAFVKANEKLKIKPFKPLSVELVIHLGGNLLNLLVESTGAFKIDMKYKELKSYRILRPTPETNKILNESPEFFAYLNPIYPIMVCPPKPWTGLKSGGYYLAGGKLQPSLVKQPHKILKEYASEFSIEAMPKVYEAVNQAQNTSWKINSKVYEVMKTLWDMGGGMVKGVPNKFALELPSKPWGNEPISDEELKLYRETHEEEFNNWKRRTAEVHNANHKNTLLRCVMRRKLEIAEKYKDEKAIYFPHTLDSRGRIYPLPSYVTPQGDDSGKALIRFKEGKPLKNSLGVDWLAIHGANLAGIDKESFEDRIKWVKENEYHIKMSAENPLDYTWWMTLDEKPFQFLAFCFEWSEYLRLKESNGDGFNFISHLPIAQDGTCNGLQHLSAMLLDNIGGRAVNLSFSEKPQDIYTLVLNKTRELIESDLMRPDIDATEKLIGETWLKEDNLDRKVVKRPVMTTPYNVSMYGIRDQINEFSLKLFKVGECAIPPSKFTEYLSGHLVSAIDEVIVSAKLAMNYLKDASRIYCKETSNMVSWTTPLTNFKVYQASFKSTTKRIEIFQGSQRIQLSANTDTSKVNLSKQLSGVAPNFIHSLDASMLMQTILKCKANNIGSLALIHDSYGTHACDSENLARLLREAFIDLYTCNGGDVLRGFKENLEAKALETNLETISLPELPEKGLLDIYEVMDSPYFFS